MITHYEFSILHHEKILNLLKEKGFLQGWGKGDDHPVRKAFTKEVRAVVAKAMFSQAIEGALQGSGLSFLVALL